VPLHRSTPLIQRSWRQQLFLYFSFVPEMLHRSTFIELAKNLLGVAHPGEPVLRAHCLPGHLREVMRPSKEAGATQLPRRTSWSLLGVFFTWKLV
jgi:hypothetical protein